MIILKIIYFILCSIYQVLRYPIEFAASVLRLVPYFIWVIMSGFVIWWIVSLFGIDMREESPILLILLSFQSLILMMINPFERIAVFLFQWWVDLIDFIVNTLDDLFTY